MNNVGNNGIRNTQIPTSCSGLHDIEIIIGDSPIRTLTRDMIPQLDGPTSICSTGRALENVRNEQEITQGSTIIPREGYPNESKSDSHDNRRPHDGRRSPGRRRYQEKSERPPDRENSSQHRGYLGRGRSPDRNRGPPDDRGPPDGGGPPDDGGPLDDGGPPDGGGPLEMGEIQDTLEDEDHQAHQDSLD